MEVLAEPATAALTEPRLFARICHVILGLSVALVLGVATILLYFALPANDDFVCATRPLELGWWGYVFGFIYMKWQGRWSSCGLKSLIMPRVNITQYYWTLIGGVVLVNTVGIYVVVRYFARTAPKRAVLGMTLAMLALLWAGMPSPNEEVYWFTGSVENAMVLALAAMLVVWLCRRQRPGVTEIALMSLCAFVIVGFHELFGTMLLMALSAGLVIAFRCRTANRIAWLVVTISAVVGLAFVALAPGNSQRFVTDGGPHSRELLYGLRIAISQCFFYPKWWLLDPKLVAATIWVVCRGLRSRDGTTTLGDRSVQWHLLWIGPAVWCAMLAFGFYLPSWALGAKMPMRTLSGIYVVFVGGWLINVHLWTRWLANRRSLASLSFSTLAVAGSFSEIMLALSLLLLTTTPESHRTGWQTTGHFADAIVDLQTNIVPWRNAVEDRYAFLHRSPGGDVRVPPLPSGTRLLLAGEIVTPGPVIFTKSIRAYFGVRDFHVVPPPAADPPPRR